MDITNNLLVNDFQFFISIAKVLALFVQILKKKIAQIQSSIEKKMELKKNFKSFKI